MLNAIDLEAERIAIRWRSAFRHWIVVFYAADTSSGSVSCREHNSDDESTSESLALNSYDQPRPVLQKSLQRVRELGIVVHICREP